MQTATSVPNDDLTMLKRERIESHRMTFSEAVDHLSGKRGSSWRSSRWSRTGAFLERQDPKTGEWEPVEKIGPKEIKRLLEEEKSKR